MNKKINTTRQSNFELLRIISILMIIMHHYAYYINQNGKVIGISLNNIIIDILYIGGKIGVTIFVLIAGYFGIKNEFKIKKMIKLLFEILFYSIILLILNISINGIDNIDMKEVMKSLFPITFSLYWFATTYVILYVLSPFINKLINNLNKEQIKKLLFILIVLIYIIPTITNKIIGFGNVGMFITLYIIGAYIRLKDSSKSNKNCLIYFVLCIIFIIAMQLLCEWKNINKYINYFANMNNIVVLISSVSLFMCFKNIKIQSNFINKIASTTFGVYLIHSNYFMHEFIWGKLFNNTKYYISNDYKILIHASISISLTYIICVVLDLFRIYCIEKWTLPIIYKISNLIKNIVTDKMNKVKTII